MILGITGSIGCGKSAVLAAFAAHRWQTADADRICRRLCGEPAGTAVREIVRRWGEEILDENRVPDRRKLARIVFRDERELAALTGILYPALQSELAARVADWRRERVHGVLEIPLFYEAGIDFGVDRVIAVWAERSVRHARLCGGRGFTEEEIRLREARQLDPDEKLERADFALINNGTPRQLEQQVSELIKQVEAI